MLRQKTKSIAEVIEEYISESHLEEGLQRVRVFEAWDLLIGQMFVPGSSLDEAAKLTTTRFFKDGILTCRISSSVLRTQLRFTLPSLKDKLNSMLQGDIVKEIRLT
ncbi:MAG: DUF721 domain-containing protein [Bacteroidales bacterium]|nr:DUF721 domain-containing protein [Candidatus Cacconaster merdequi]